MAFSGVIIRDIPPDARKCRPRYLKVSTRPTGRPLQVKIGVVGAGDLAEGWDTTITFVFVTLISMCNVAQ